MLGLSFVSPPLDIAQLTLLKKASTPEFRPARPVLPANLKRFSEGRVISPEFDPPHRPSHGNSWVWKGMLATLLLLTAWWAANRGASGTDHPTPLPAVEAALPVTGTRQQATNSGSLEFSGFRVVRDQAGVATVHFVVVNHSKLEAHNASVEVVLRSSTAKPYDQPLANFHLKLPLFAAQESKEASTRVDIAPDTILPEWTDLRADVKVTQQQ